MAPRSQQLVAPQAIGVAVADIYTVPADHTTIVRSVLIFNGSGASRTITLSVKTPPAGGVSVAKFVVGAAADSINYLPYLVLEEGQVLQAIATGTGCNIVVSGPELEGT